MTNRLAGENSPYLLQHANNPVDWFPWDFEALEKARREDKPIFLSIGYSACHWCHVMAHETFEDPEIAAFLNDNFVSIKVDREERPDLDSLYMNAVVALTGQGGWPMTVFLTPQCEPFYGGTYFPPTPRFNLPSFRDVILTIARLWQDDRPKLLQSAKEIVQQIVSVPSARAKSTPLSAEILDQAVYRLAQSYDWKFGGWGQAPKFPQPMVIEFLLQRASYGDKLALDVALHSLDAMSQGGMYDIVGGGFARYSTDNNWLVPHFEKMLYDNAQLAKVYLYAYLITRQRKYQDICQSTLDFLEREMRSPQGGFHSSLDADSGGIEGQYYLWELVEIKAYLTEAQAQSAQFHTVNWVDFFVDAYGVTQQGNYEGRTILRKKMDNARLTDKYKLLENDVEVLLNEMNQSLLARRSKRVRPNTDDKVLASWNALALVVFAEAGRYLDNPFYLEIASQNATFLWENLHIEKRLFRSWRDGKAQHNAYLEDYSALILAFIALYQSGFETIWFERAKLLMVEVLTHFQDPGSGFFDTSDDHEKLLMRLKDIQDNAIPSGNSLAVLALLQLAKFDDMEEWRGIAEQALVMVKSGVLNFPLGYGKWLCALFEYFSNSTEIALLFPDKENDLPAYKHVLWSTYQPNSIVALATYPPLPGGPKLLQNRPIINNQPTVYVCHNFVCDLPIQTPEQLVEKLKL